MIIDPPTYQVLQTHILVEDRINDFCFPNISYKLYAEKNGLLDFSVEVVWVFEYWDYDSHPGIIFRHQTKAICNSIFTEKEKVEQTKLEIFISDSFDQAEMDFTVQVRLTQSQTGFEKPDFAHLAKKLFLNLKEA